MNKVSANPSSIDWPQDVHQLTRKLRAEGMRASYRVLGHPDKLEVLLATLDVLKAHTLARYKKARTANSNTKDAAKVRRDAAAAASEKSRLAAVAVAEKQLAHLKGDEPAKEPATPAAKPAATSVATKADTPADKPAKSTTQASPANGAFASKAGK